VEGERSLPPYSQARWCCAYLLCLFFAKNRESVQGIGLVIPDEVFASGALLEPLFTLIAEFEDRKMRFYMRERKITKFYARMLALERKYAHIRFVESHAKLLRYVVNRMSLVADRLTLQCNDCIRGAHS
jgi:hypothetical protein